MAAPKRLTVIAAVAVLLGAALLADLPLSTTAAAQAKPTRNCKMDAIEQSICIYQAILADVSKTYQQRGGGGISGIVQKSTTTFTVQLAQEGHTDIVTYTVKIGPDGKVKIVEKTQSSESY
jgi:hypothetical protein